MAKSILSEPRDDVNHFTRPECEYRTTSPQEAFCSYIILEGIMYYTYLLECQDDKSWYIEQTGNLKKRIVEHQGGYGARTTSLKNNWKLIYYEAYTEKQDAIGRERFLKSGSGRTYLNKQLVNYFKI